MVYTKEEHDDELALAQSLLDSFLRVVKNEGLAPDGKSVLQATLLNGKTLELRNTSDGKKSRYSIAFMVIALGTNEADATFVSAQYEVKTATVSDSSVFQGDVYQKVGHIQWAYPQKVNLVAHVETLKALLVQANWTLVQWENSKLFKSRTY